MSTVRVHHFGLTVSDIAQTARFYGRLGFQTPSKVVKNHYEWFGHWVGNPGALGHIAFMQHGDVMFELHQYDHPKGLSAVSPSTVYLGCPHIAIEVEDVRSLYEDLKVEGVDFLGPPTVIDEGETPGYVGVYCRDPDGYIVELVQEPDGGGMDIADYAV